MGRPVIARCRSPQWFNVYDPDRWRPSDRLRLLAYTGCFWSEAAGLRSCDDSGDHLELVQVWPRDANEPRSDRKASARVPRDIPVISRLRPVLERLHAYARSGYLLSGPDGRRLAYETWRHRLAAAARETKAGGWESLDMVSDVYGHLWPSDVVELGRRVDALDRDARD